jgi:hypothetical protein
VGQGKALPGLSRFTLPGGFTAYLRHLTPADARDFRRWDAAHPGATLHEAPAWRFSRGVVGSDGGRLFSDPRELVVGVLMPTLVGALLGGAQSFDDRTRMEDAYMQAVCTQVMELPRDESLCECVLATEHPALDCQAPFLAWSVDRQGEYCITPENEKASLSFCTCVKTVAELMAAAPDEDATIKAAQAYRNCQALADAVYLPAIEELAGS